MNIRQTMLGVMREMLKQSKFVNKANMFSVMQTKVDRDAFEKELEAMQHDGCITQAYDVNTFCLVE